MMRILTVTGSPMSPALHHVLHQGDHEIWFGQQTPRTFPSLQYAGATTIQVYAVHRAPRNAPRRRDQRRRVVSCELRQERAVHGVPGSWRKMSLAVPHVRREPARVQHRRVREARPVPPAQNAEGQLRLRHHRRAHCPRRPQRSPKYTCRRPTSLSSCESIPLIYRYL